MHSRRHVIAPGVLFDVGIPMLALAWPLFWLTFIPVVLIEAEVAHRQLRLVRKDALKLSTAANALSTLVGIPVAWVALVLLEMGVGGVLSAANLDMDKWAPALFPVMSAWLGNIDDVRIVFAAFVFLAVPFCIASIYLEYRVARRRFPEIDAARLYIWARTANIYSYGCVVVTAAVYTLIQWHKAA